MAKFVKGQSGNPAGRPKGIERAINETIAAIVEAHPDDQEAKINGWVALTLRAYRIAMGSEPGTTPRDSIAAIKFLHERVCGYPRQTSDVNVGGPALDKSDVSKMTDEELIELAGVDHTGERA